MSQFVLQIGGFIWVGEDGLPTPYAALAARYEEADAKTRAAALLSAGPGKTGSAWLDTMARRAFEIYGEDVITVVPTEEHQKRITGFMRGSAPKPEPRVAAQAGESPLMRIQEQGRGTRQGGGITAQIRDWVAANPQATRQDALRQFPDANPSTVGVQFGAAKKSQQA